ncbi:hypothetical protein [Thermosipho sp. (in: thermotogales)]|jgi:predicted  nucleic acid-binding Zn-ribbon protein|uniref:hypothetical protein n=1 Tax=Thermosipho sp. (in: thermotogales) TaxID=1968895 RepID=UPI00257FCBC6|nr:hypothetical protein [Thermosipho sp. (in: thermotogales)]MBZ4649226.1 hypothetical protein [Thermosipho sp. (in: thermotogales)]
MFDLHKVLDTLANDFFNNDNEALTAVSFDGGKRFSKCSIRVEDRHITIRIFEDSHDDSNIIMILIDKIDSVTIHSIGRLELNLTDNIFGNEKIVLYKMESI